MTLITSRLLRIRWKQCHRTYPFRSFEPKFIKSPYPGPFFLQAQQAHHDGIRGRSFLWLQLYLGLAWTVGCIFFGAVADNRWLQLWSFGPYRKLLFEEKKYELLQWIKHGSKSTEMSKEP